MEILLLQDQEEVRERLMFSLESQYGANMHDAHTIEGALKIIQEKGAGKIDLLVYDYQKGTPASYPSLWSMAKGIPTVVCAPPRVAGAPEFAVPQDVSAQVIDRSELFEQIFGAVEAFLSTGQVKRADNERGYCRIRTKLLISVSPLKADIFIRLSDVKFLKLFQEGDSFTAEDLEKYTTKKGIEFLYLKADQCGEFVQKYRQDLEKILKAPTVPTVAAASQTADRTHETLRQLIVRIGFNKEIEELAKTQVQIMVRSMGRSPTLKDLFAKLHGHEGKYIASHSVACCYVACGLASLMEWGSESTYYKLAMASYFHDIALDNDKLAEIETLEELEAQKALFTGKEYREYKFHTVRAAEVLKKMSEMPPDVDTIIAQHHERPDGLGFPRGAIHTHITPLASLFIIAHDMVRCMRKQGPQFSVKDFMARAQEIYCFGNFKKIIRAMAAAG